MMTKFALIAAVVLAGLAALFVAADGKQGGAKPGSDQSAAAGKQAGGGRPAPTPDRKARGGNSIDYRGLAIQMQSGFGPLDNYVPLMREVAGLGANTVLLCTAGYMEHAKAQAIFVDARKTPAPDEFKALIREARKLNLRVIIMPIVLLTHPRGSEWRGVIEPPDWTEWWTSYREFLIYFADIARDGGADGLIVGSELVSTESKTAEWVRLIGAVREHFPAGKLGYSANWDHYKPIRFWDKLDFIGMTSYYTLADKELPTVEDIVARWRPIHDQVAAWAREVNKPVILTEVGWCSQKGAAMAPWNYYQNQKGSPEGLEEQKRLYEAFLKVWDNSPVLSGVIWWEWTAEPGGVEDFGYSPRNKPAEKVLREWFAAGRPEPPAEPAVRSEPSAGGGGPAATGAGATGGGPR